MCGDFLPPTSYISAKNESQILLLQKAKRGWAEHVLAMLKKGGGQHSNVDVAINAGDLSFSHTAREQKVFPTAFGGGGGRRNV